MTDEVGEDTGLDAAAPAFDPLLAHPKEAEELAPELRRSFTEGQQQRMERNKQLALERRRARRPSSSQAPGSGNVDAGFCELPLVSRAREKWQPLCHSPHLDATGKGAV